jgi:hypothetical protein
MQRRGWRYAMASIRRVLLGFAVVGAGFLSGSFQYVGAQSVGEAAQVAEEEKEASTSPADAYGIRYATRKLVMPKGMIRGTFDVVIGDVVDDNTATINLGVAISPLNHLELGFSRYRMGSYPNPDFLRALGGDGLIPIIAEDGDLVPFLATNGRAFGDMFAYVRAEVPDTSVVDVGFDLGFLIPTASEFGVLFGLPLRFHGGDVFAFDTGLMISVDNMGGAGGSFTSISLPWNVVLSVTDMVFVKLNSGMNALDVGDGGALKVFPFGFGVGVTTSSERLMSDIFAAFSWPLLGSVVPGFGFSDRSSETTTDFWTITLGVNFYSPVLF